MSETTVSQQSNEFSFNMPAPCETDYPMFEALCCLTLQQKQHT